MDGSYLTPTLTGQFCSYLVDSDGVWIEYEESSGDGPDGSDIDDGTPCLLTYYDALNGAV
jgi:hypothetical protein